jgi:hypothetical protein
MLSLAANRTQPACVEDDFIIHGHVYRHADHTNIQYHVQSFKLAQRNPGSLSDGGDNGGLEGADFCLIDTNNDKADASGIGDALIKDLITTVAGLIQTTSGPVIGIFHQYAYHIQGKTIHAPNQFCALTWMSMKYH